MHLHAIHGGDHAAKTYHRIGGAGMCLHVHACVPRVLVGVRVHVRVHVHVQVHVTSLVSRKQAKQLCSMLRPQRSRHC